MKPKILSAFITIFIIVGFASCNKPPLPFRNLYECSEENALDSIETADALIGEWEWRFVKCYSTPKEANNDDEKGLVIEFRNDKTLDVIKDGKVTQAATWKVVSGIDESYQLQLDPIQPDSRLPGLAGKIHICEDRLEFYHSYIHGCDNYYKRQ